MISRNPQIVGREAELAALDAFVAADGGRRAIVLSGGPGIGKTTLWEAGIARARELGVRLLTARASEAAARLPFAALIDLLDGVETAELAVVPAPQLRALEVALLRAEPAVAPLDPGAVAVAFLNALRALTARERLLVAVDDVQWLDPSSAEVLVFAARRIERPVQFLLAQRPSGQSPLMRALEPADRLAVRPLSLGATRRLLSQRLRLSVPRHLLRRVAEASLGNPFFALEIGRTLIERGLPAPGEELPIPATVEDLLGPRLERLPASVRRVLLAVALSGELRSAEVAAFAGADALEDAVDAGVLVIEADRVRASHPLLAATARRHSQARERRGLHLVLAGIVGDVELRARHLARAADRPDAALAATARLAATSASARGARFAAVEMAEHALRLTPSGSPERPVLVLELGKYLAMAGEPRRVTELLEPKLDALPQRLRARARLLLCEDGMLPSREEHRRQLEAAFAESEDDPSIRAAVLADLSIDTAATCIERIGEAEQLALEALTRARDAGGGVERVALEALGWARALRGRPIDDVCDSYSAASEAAVHLAASPERVAVQRLVWRGEVGRARAIVTGLLAAADERGELASYALLRLHLCELELRVGRWTAARQILDEWAESSEGEILHWPMYERCVALLAAGRGLTSEAEEWAARAIAKAEDQGSRWDLLEALRARGVAELVARRPARAVDHLRVVWEHTQREGVEEPGVFPVAPDLVEGLVELGELDEARAVAVRLADLAERQEHPWGLATASRCQGVIALAGARYDEDAAAALEAAAADYGRLGLHSDRARALLTLGRLHRRHRKWGAARARLEAAASAFEQLDAPGWVTQAHSELSRISGRRPHSAGELTPTERRVAELAAGGMTNKEIAQALVVTVNTVETHLTRLYAKLGIHSRAQLSRRLRA